ncbi:MAG: GNAT family N-acetyltransferase [Prevotella sp.]|nr:GNAT family N-acetyltransferase [Prevotella sp.]
MIGFYEDKALRLRALEPEDLDFLYAIENDVELWDVGNANVPYSRFSLNNYLLSSSSDIYADKQMRLVMEDNHGTPVGLLDIFNFDPRHSRAELGIAVEKRVRNHGYGCKAVRLAVEYAKSVLHLHQLYAVVGAYNSSSLKIFQEAGFSKGATLKEWIFDGQCYHDALVMQIFM